MKTRWSGVAVVLLCGGVAIGAEAGSVTETIQAPSEEHPVVVKLSGGFEGYAGTLAPRIKYGPTYGLSVLYDMSRVFGFEVGYTGSASQLKTANTGGPVDASGIDLLRNGGYLAALPGMTFVLGSHGGASLKPYALGGIGADRYSPRSKAQGVGYQNATVANVPFGAGLQARVGDVIADARFNAAWEFGNAFSPFTDNPIRYATTLQIGASF